jgi:hypothetical protein
VWTSYGWTWVSYEPFGWATYHYGYWDCDNSLGWVWIPGYSWSASRVQFAYYDNYVCWAPMTPPGYACPRPFTTAGFNIWFTIGASHFCDPYPARYCVTPSYNSVYTNRVAYKSPARTYVQQYTHAPIRQTTVAFKNTTFVRGNQFNGSRSQTIVKSKQQPYVRNSRPYTQPLTRDSRTTQNSRQYKSAPQQKPFIDARAMQQRQRDPGLTRQYQPREAQRAPARQTVRPLFEPRHEKDVARATSRSPRVERAQPQQVQRSVAHGNQGHQDVAKMKGGNGRGAGKH